MTLVLPTSTIRTGPSAKGAMAAGVGMVSEMSRMLTSRPRSSPVPVTVIASSATRTSAPMRSRTRTNSTSPCSARGPRPGTVTARPVGAAAAKE